MGKDDNGFYLLFPTPNLNMPVAHSLMCAYGTSSPQTFLHAWFNSYSHDSPRSEK